MPETQLIRFLGGIRKDVPEDLIPPEDFNVGYNTIIDGGQIGVRRGHRKMVYDDTFVTREGYHLGVVDGSDNNLIIAGDIIWYYNRLIIGAIGTDEYGLKTAGLYFLEKMADGRYTFTLIENADGTGIIPLVDESVYDDTKGINKKYLQAIPRKWSFVKYGDLLYCFTDTLEHLVFDGRIISRLNIGSFINQPLARIVKPFKEFSYGYYNSYSINGANYKQITKDNGDIAYQEQDIVEFGVTGYFKQVAGRPRKKSSYVITNVSELFESDAGQYSNEIQETSAPVDIYDIGARSLGVFERHGDKLLSFDKRVVLTSNGVLSGASYFVTVSDEDLKKIKVGDIINHYTLQSDNIWSRDVSSTNVLEYVVRRIDGNDVHFADPDTGSLVTASLNGTRFPVAGWVDVAYRYDDLLGEVLIHEDLVADWTVDRFNGWVAVIKIGNTIVRRLITDTVAAAITPGYSDWGFTDPALLAFVVLDRGIGNIGGSYETDTTLNKEEGDVQVYFEQFSRFCMACEFNTGRDNLIHGLTSDYVEKWRIDESNEKPASAYNTVVSLILNMTHNCVEIEDATFLATESFNIYIYDKIPIIDAVSGEGNFKPDLRESFLYRKEVGKDVLGELIDRMDLVDSPSTIGDTVTSPVWRDGYYSAGKILDSGDQPGATYGATVWKNRVWGFKDRWLYYSQPSIFSSWPNKNAIEFPYDIVGVSSLREAEIASVDTAGIVILTKGGLYSLRDSEKGFVPYVMDDKVRCVSYKGHVSVNGLLYFMTNRGPYVTDGRQVKDISYSIRNMFVGDYSDFVDIEDCKCGYDIENNEIQFSLNSGNSSEGEILGYPFSNVAYGIPALDLNDVILCYSIDRDKWSTKSIFTVFGVKGFQCITNDGVNTYYGLNAIRQHLAGIVDGQPVYYYSNSGNIFKAYDVFKENETYTQVSIDVYYIDNITGTYELDEATQQFIAYDSSPVKWSKTTIQKYIPGSNDGDNVPCYMETGYIDIADGKIVDVGGLSVKSPNMNSSIGVEVFSDNMVEDYQGTYSMFLDKKAIALLDDYDGFSRLRFDDDKNIGIVDGLNNFVETMEKIKVVGRNVKIRIIFTDPYPSRIDGIRLHMNERSSKRDGGQKNGR
jgi:hypothetical protein